MVLSSKRRVDEFVFTCYITSIIWELNGESMQIGFSTGALYKSVPDDADRVAAIREIGCDTIELGFVKMVDFTSQRLNSLSPGWFSGFKYASLHAPIYNYKRDIKSDCILYEIYKLHLKIPLDLVVFHPDTVVDFSVFHGLPFKIGFENMDNRKKSFKTPLELQDLLAENPEFGFVLDVNHAYSNDPSGRLTAEFYEKSGSRLSQIHLSGYTGGHEPLFKTRQADIVFSIRNFDAPIIIESIVEPKELKKEMLYVAYCVAASGLD